MTDHTVNLICCAYLLTLLAAGFLMWDRGRSR